MSNTPINALKLALESSIQELEAKRAAAALKPGGVAKHGIGCAFTERQFKLISRIRDDYGVSFAIIIRGLVDNYLFALNEREIQEIVEHEKYSARNSRKMEELHKNLERIQKQLEGL